MFYVLDDENRAREIIISTLSESYLEKDVKRAFYNLIIDLSPEDSYYRDSEGSWEQK